MPDDDSATCPLCNIKGGKFLGALNSRDASAYECPRCGYFVIDVMIPHVLMARWEKQRYVLVGQARAWSDRGARLEITPTNIEELITSAPVPRSALEYIDRILLILAGRTSSYWDDITWDQDTDFPLIYARDASDFAGTMSAAYELGYVRFHPTSITLSGWQRVDVLRQARPDSRQAFVAMWFDSEMDSAWLEGFQPGINESDYYKAVRIDSVEHNGKIDDRIVAEIRRSGLVVADFTGSRGGVYFEAGLAQGLGIPVIWTCRRDYVTALHFDTRQYNHIVWDDPKGLREALLQRIRATILTQHR